MKPADAVCYVLLISILACHSASAQLVPPQQDYYLHFSQKPDFCCGGDALANGEHELAWIQDGPVPVVTDALTVEAWVLWEPSDLEEIGAATGIDIDRMTLFCGQAAYGFQYRSYGAPGWTFFLQTDPAIFPETFPDTGNIPLPMGEWAHLAATYDGEIIRTFLNGVQQTETATFPGTSIDRIGGAFNEQCSYSPAQSLIGGDFSIGVGMGFTGGIRQLRIWNRALPQAEILTNAGLHLVGDEPGLLAYWPLGDQLPDVHWVPADPISAPNKVVGGPPLVLRLLNDQQMAKWRMIDPLFVVREDLVEDVLVSDCPSLVTSTSALVNVQTDGDRDLIFTGATRYACGSGLYPFWALILDGENGLVFDTAAAIGGTVPLAGGSIQMVTADFNNDGQLDIFSANTGEDFCVGVGAPNTLLLSRPDGRVEDASDNLLGPPCNADIPQFEGQHLCYAGGGEFGRVPGKRYPGTGDAVTPDPGFTHSAAAGDIDGDGDVDILAGNVAHHNIEPPYLLLNDGQGSFLANWQLMPDHLNGNSGEDELAPSDRFLLEDMDGDGHVDLVAGPQTGTLSGDWIAGISWNDGSGDFSSADRFMIEPTPGIPNGPGGGRPISTYGIVATDIDGDNDKDLLLMWEPGDLPGELTGSLQILVNTGGRIFVDESVSRVGAPPQTGISSAPEFSVGNVTNDGCPDLVFHIDLWHERSLAIWLNDCEGNFSPMSELILPTPGGRYIPLDYDGDGDMDLLSAISRPVNYAGTAGCSAGEGGGGSDYIDFAVLLNTSPADTDGDGVADIYDLFPDDPNEWFDADSDGIGENADLDDDNDGIPDVWESGNGLNLRDAADANADGDADSLTNINEYRAGTDPRVADTDGDAVLDGADNCPTINNTGQVDRNGDGTGEACTPRLFASLGDLSSNGFGEIGVALPGSVNVHVRDGSSDAVVNDIDFGSDPGIAIEVIVDLNNNGAPEIAVLGLRPDGNVRVQIKDSLTGAVVNNIFYGSAFSAIDMAVLPDTDGNGAPELAVLGQDAGNGVRVQARDALTDAATSTTYYGSNATAIDVEVIPDVSGNGKPEIAMHARVIASDQTRVQLRDSDTRALIRQMFFGTVYAPRQIAVINDVTGDGIPELAQLARRTDTGAVRVQVKNPVDGSTVSNAFTGNADRPVDIVGTGGVIGMLVEDAAGVAKVIKRDAATGAFIGNVFVGAVGTPEALVVIDDLNGGGDPEFAALGNNAGQRIIQIKDSVSGVQINNINVP